MHESVSKIGRLVFTSLLLVMIVAVFLAEVVILEQRRTVASESPRNSSSGDVSVASDKSDIQDKELVIAEVVADDARPLLIRRYLEKYKSPLAPYSDLIFQLSQTYGFEYYWIVAIAQQESNLCKKIPENSHNCWGYGIHKNGTLKFDNYELALNSYAEYLKRVYFDKGLDTPELIMKKYCPSSNGSWAAGVRQFIDDIESGNF